jgi:hypothetical protein
MANWRRQKHGLFLASANVSGHLKKIQNDSSHTPIGCPNQGIDVLEGVKTATADRAVRRDCGQKQQVG